MKNIDKLKKEYEAMGETIRELEQLEEANIDHGKLAEVMPKGVLCNVANNRRSHSTRFRQFRRADRDTSFPYASDSGSFMYIQFPTKPILPWLGESSKPPVHPDTNVKVWYKNGETYTNEAKYFMWGWTNRNDDIVAYQVEEWA